MNRIDASKIKHWLSAAIGIFAIWMLATVLAFSLSTAARFVPGWVEVPWSFVDDVTYGASGRIYVYTGLWGRLLCYEADGSFCGSSTLEGKGRLSLVSTAAGQLIVRKSDMVCIGQEAQFGAWDCSIWRLEEGSCLIFDAEVNELLPVAIVDTSKITMPTLQVPSGTPMFCPRERSAGLRLELFPSSTVRFGRGLTLTHRSPSAIVEVRGLDNELLAIAESAWYLEWARFPWPGHLPWFLLGIAVAFKEIWKRRRAKTVSTDPNSDL